MTFDTLLLTTGNILAWVGDCSRIRTFCLILWIILVLVIGKKIKGRGVPRRGVP